MVGVGPGDASFLTPAAGEAVAAAQVLVGAPRHLEALAGSGQETFPLAGDLAGAAEFIRGRVAAGRAVAVLATGDPGLFGILAFLRRRFSATELLVIPGVSAVQLAFARLALPWQDAVVVSAHGRHHRAAIAAVLRGAKAAVFTDPPPAPAELARELLAAGAPPMEVYLLGDLSYPAEGVYRYTLRELADGPVCPHRQVILVFPGAPEGVTPAWPYRTGGIPDGLFLRGPTPMTKEETRALVLAKLRLADGQVIWDIGAGTGSVSVEAALTVPLGQVWAVERATEGMRLIEANRRKFGAANLHPVAGAAPEALRGLPPPDRVFVGGSGGALEEILRYTARTLRPGGRLVVSTVTLETQGRALALLGELFGRVEAVQTAVAVSREAGASHLWQARNPVCLLTVEKGR